ncbi:hypothetical protein MNBD_UNCLBAC01-1427 [hydrothermal vent metagenome]|uniref:Uncharacterized protein n=1 Tax=hydrothermal vent metagenome TaxID=652676 RepID=A0A3B1DVZ4_9ZZZZ
MSTNGKKMGMNYQCSVCHKEIQGDMFTYIEHTEKHIIDEIKASHPEWVENDGLCKKCMEYYQNQLKGKKSSH